MRAEATEPTQDVADKRRELLEEPLQVAEPWDALVEGTAKYARLSQARLVLRFS